MLEVKQRWSWVGGNDELCQNLLMGYKEDREFSGALWYSWEKQIYCWGWGRILILVGLREKGSK